MKIYKIQIYNNTTVDLSVYLTPMFQFFQKRGVTFNYDITNVFVPVPPSTLVNNPMVGNVYVIEGVEHMLPTTDHDMTLFFFDYSNWKAPWYWPWPLWGNIPRDSTYLVNGKPFITIGYWPTDQTVAQRFLHEPMHALAKIFGCTDVLDSYYLDSTPDAPNGNFAQQFAIFKPYLQASTSPQDTTLPPTAILTRLSDNGVETRGRLVIKNGANVFSCDTLELPWLNNQHDISCVPQGTYTCNLQPFHNTKMYQLSPTAPRTGIFIHPANFKTDILGCIALGDSFSDINKDGQLDVINSVHTVTAMMTFLNNNPFTLQIINAVDISKI